MARNNRNRLNRRALLNEARHLHDMSVGPEHCDPKYISTCVCFQQLVPQAAENIREGRAATNGTGLPRV